jgi:hypothetical protein
VDELLNAPSEETNLVNPGLVPTEIHPFIQDALAYWRRHLWRSAIFSKTEKNAVLTENISLAIDTLAYAA